MANKPWTEPEIRILKANLERSDRAISDRLTRAGFDRSSRAVEQYRKALGVRRVTTPWTPDRMAELVKLYKQRLSAQQIAQALGCGFTRNSVIGKLARMRLTSPERGERRRQQSQLDQARRMVRKPPPPTKAVAAYQFGPGGPRSPEPKPAQVIATAGPTPQSLNLRMWDPAFKTGCCKWATGEDDQGFRFCADVAVPGVPYCALHARKAFSPTPPKGPPSGVSDAQKAKPSDDGEPQPLDFERAA